MIAERSLGTIIPLLAEEYTKRISSEEMEVNNLLCEVEEYVKRENILQSDGLRLLGGIPTWGMFGSVRSTK